MDGPPTDDTPTDAAVYDHLRPTGADYPDGVYRVVGRPDGDVTLLRVADGDGRRVNSGQLVRVPGDELDGFETASDPDAGFSPLASIREGFEGIGILIRELVR